MKTLGIFKISENQKKIDTVELLFDELENIFIVKWKWTTMKTTMERYFKNVDDAEAKYMERKQFAITCYQKNLQ